MRAHEPARRRVREHANPRVRKPASARECPSTRARKHARARARKQARACASPRAHTTTQVFLHASTRARARRERVNTRARELARMHDHARACANTREHTRAREPASPRAHTRTSTRAREHKRKCCTLPCDSRVAGYMSMHKRIRCMLSFSQLPSRRQWYFSCPSTNKCSFGLHMSCIIRVYKKARTKPSPV